ncbi:thymidine kinase [Alicyclobacillus fastidiosus]|uniref:Thymidine kinase n=1 Tax=Alicyclobacillus fastidiosus TaxID=392011 RepID=A0ABY6ZGV7_9BACL|nr:thymidine kinase [Alicyclobacillus fastidiosus]WAH42139.1 thymidine kinase [Alicyclobacillus fastidiosus]GMA63924.1 thymidine kinase [Alicyclobacillus fastidiosus]
MAKLYYRFGQMNASKSIQLLTVAHNYEEQGKKVTLFTPAIDARFGRGQISSRVGIAKDAIEVDDDTNLFEQVKEAYPDCVLVDEVQFLRAYHIQQLARVVDELNIPAIMYGLLKDYRNEFFEGSRAAVLWADQIEEIKTICAHPDCNRKATMILKIKDGVPVYAGEQIEVGGNDLYRSVCRRHYFHPDVGRLF